MKITFVTAGWGLSGGDRVIAIYADRLRRRGHDVLLVAPAVSQPRMIEKLKRAMRGDAAGLRHDEEEPTHLHPDVARRRLNQTRPVADGDLPDADVVIATWWETAEWVMKLSPSKGAKTVFLQHYEAFDYVPKNRVDAVWRLPMHKITISKWLVELARVKFGDSRVSLIFNSVDTDQFHAPPRQRNALPTIGMMYSDAHWKGSDVCLAAISGLPFPVKVVAFSASVQRPGEGTLPALPPGSDFYYRPAQDSIREIYSQCDVWLCGSRSEGFHLPPLEAMACRCPVVSTAVGGPVDIVRDGVNGYVVSLEDVAALTDRLDRVLTRSEPEWQKLSDNALTTAVSYSWDQATDLFEAALSVAVQRRGQGEIG